MKTKRLTKTELTKLVEAKLQKLRGGYVPVASLTNPQEREIAQWVLGQITMLDEVHMMLTGLRQSFI